MRPPIRILLLESSEMNEDDWESAVSRADGKLGPGPRAGWVGRLTVKRSFRFFLSFLGGKLSLSVKKRQVQGLTWFAAAGDPAQDPVESVIRPVVQEAAENV